MTAERKRLLELLALPETRRGVDRFSEELAPQPLARQLCWDGLVCAVVRHAERELVVGVGGARGKGATAMSERRAAVDAVAAVLAYAHEGGPRLSRKGVRHVVSLVALGLGVC